MAQNTQTPGLSDVLAAWVRAGIAQIHTSFPATIVTYDPSTQKATVQPIVAPRVDDTELDIERPGEPFKPVPNLPVLWPSSSQGSLTFGLVPGDAVMVLVAERSTDEWRTNGTPATLPLDARRFDMSDGVVIPGGRSFNPTTGPLGPLTVGTEVDTLGATVVGGTLPTAGLLLGSAAALESVLLGDLSETDLTTWLNGLTPLLAALTAPVVTDELAWIVTINGAAGTFQPIHAAFVGQVSSGVHRSLKVKVDL